MLGILQLFIYFAISSFSDFLIHIKCKYFAKRCAINFYLSSQWWPITEIIKIYECDIWPSSSFLSNHGANMSWHSNVQSKTEWKAKL